MKNFIDPVRLGLAGGLIWGITVFVVTLISLANGYAVDFLMILASVYPGYSISVNGSLLGFLYGFADAFVGLFILGWVYNLLGPKKIDRH